MPHDVDTRSTDERTPASAVDDAAAFAASPPSVPPALVQPSVSPSQTRKCEGCARAHPGNYGSGRFCSASCAKKVGARHKWAARPAAPGAARRASARRALPDAACESCSKLHDKSYGSGRFCSVHCARRVAATRKWEKSRTEKNKRLEAIRPAMLALPAPPHPPCALPVLAGKRRRVVGRQFEQLHISDPLQPLYVQQSSLYQAPHQRIDMPAPPVQQGTTATLSQQPMHPPTVMPVAQVATSYLPPPPHNPMPYQHHHHNHHHHAFEMPLVASHVVFANQNTSSSQMAGSMLYSHASLPAYRVLHPTTAPLDSRSYSPLSPPTPSPSTCPPSLHRIPLQYAPASTSHPSLSSNYAFAKSPVFDVETLSTSASPPPGEETNVKQPPKVQKADSNRDRKGTEAPVLETSSAARALLCLRATSSYEV